MTVVSPDPSPDWFALRAARWERSSFASSPALRQADVRVATLWTTVAPALAGASGPVFHLCQGYEADFSFYASHREAICASYAAPTRKLAVAPHLVERLLREGYGPVAMVGEAFEASDFRPAPERRFDGDRPVVLLVGIYDADVKGIREAGEALAGLRFDGFSFLLRRVSTLPPSSAEMGAGLVDEFHVRLTPAEMARAYRSSDLLIGPSHPEEGFGLSVLEALSSGLPVLLSDTPGHRYIAREAAVYFPCGDRDALARAGKDVLGDPPRRAALSALGPAEATRFRTAEVADRLLAEFERALAEASRA